MKNVSVTLGLAALLLAGGTRAQDITISWKASDKKFNTGYLPKVTSDGIQNMAIIAETALGLSAFESELGSYGTGGVTWSGTSNYLFSPPQTTPQIGHAPSIALAYDSATNYDNAIEVHQGGQQSESSLWYQIGTNAPPFYSAMSWSTAKQYDNGYNATVAADLNQASATTTTVVEVHQAARDTASALWYHVGVLKLGASPSMTWGPALEINSGMNQGYAPTVSIANNVAVLVAGDAGNLWYAIGVVDKATLSIAWTDPIPYGTGYNPAVSMWGDGTTSLIGPGRVVVEAHQVDKTTGSLIYTAGLMKDGPLHSAPTSITWSTTTDTSYAAGCYPSLAIQFYGYTKSSLSLVETHETACGSAGTMDYSYGYLVSK